MYSELRQKHLETCKFYKNVAAVTLNSIKIVWNPFQNDKSNKTSKINIGIKTTLVTAWIVARHGLSQATIHALHVCGSLLCIQFVEACLCIVPFVTQFCPSWLSGNFIKHCSHPPCINKPPISEMCISIRHNLYKWGLDTRGGGAMFYRQKWGRVSLQHMKYDVASGKLHQSSTFWCKHEFLHKRSSDLTNDISDDVKLNMSKIRWGGGGSKNSVQKSRDGKIFVVSIFVDKLI